MLKTLRAIAFWTVCLLFWMLGVLLMGGQWTSR
jgi:hypothetical protein